MRRHPSYHHNTHLSPARLRGLVAAIICAALLAVTGCGSLDDDGPAAGAGGVTAAQKRDAVAALERIAVTAWDSMSGYSRDEFRHWISQGSGCDTRDTVLVRDGAKVTTTQPCTVASGEWFSQYDGETVTDPHRIDIDHMVPLANAWRTGAKRWTDEQREEFANDLTRPQLLAVTATSNRAKGDQDPSQWRPARRAYWCTYATAWIAVKSHWKLSVTSAEKVALIDMLGSC